MVSGDKRLVGSLQLDGIKLDGFEPWLSLQAVGLKLIRVTREDAWQSPFLLIRVIREIRGKVVSLASFPIQPAHELSDRRRAPVEESWLDICDLVPRLVVVGMIFHAEIDERNFPVREHALIRLLDPVRFSQSRVVSEEQLHRPVLPHGETPVAGIPVVQLVVKCPVTGRPKQAGFGG